MFINSKNLTVSDVQENFFAGDRYQDGYVLGTTHESLVPLNSNECLNLIKADEFSPNACLDFFLAKVNWSGIYFLQCIWIASWLKQISEYLRAKIMYVLASRTFYADHLKCNSNANAFPALMNYLKSVSTLNYYPRNVIKF